MSWLNRIYCAPGEKKLSEGLSLCKKKRKKKKKEKRKAETAPIFRKTHLNKHLHRRPSMHHIVSRLALSECDHNPRIDCQRMKRWEGENDKGKNEVGDSECREVLVWGGIQCSGRSDLDTKK